MPGRPKLYLRSYPMPDGMEAHASAVEEDGWDGPLFTDTQNLTMDVFGSLYLAASVFATLPHVSGGRAHIGVGLGDTAVGAGRDQAPFGLPGNCVAR